MARVIHLGLTLATLLRWHDLSVRTMRRRPMAVLSICLVMAACSVSGTVRARGASSGASSPGSPLEKSPPSGWRKVSLPAAPGGPSGGYTDSGSAIACSSETKCIFGGTYLDNNSNQFSITLSTVNAGLTWARNTDFPSSLDGGVGPAACDQRNCFILADNEAVTDQALARTTDNGKTWTIIPYPPSWATNSINASLIACSSSGCLVYGDNILAVTMTATEGAYKTAFAATSYDFQTWTDVAIPSASHIDQLTCIRSGQCWAEYETAGDELEHIATTLEGGVTWTALGAIKPDELGNDSFTNSFALDPDHQVGFACADAQTCFILDNSNDLLASHDGGRTWRISQGPSRGATDAMTCTSSSTCWIVSVGPPTTAWVGLPPPRGSG